MLPSEKLNKECAHGNKQIDGEIIKNLIHLLS